VRSFCESVAVEAQKRGTRSLVTKVVREAVKPSDPSELKPDEIRDKLRASWNGDSIGSRVFARYSDGEYYPGKVTAVVRKSDRPFVTIKYDDGDENQVSSVSVRSVGYCMTRYFEWDELEG
jgi:hypothetical protein